MTEKLSITRRSALALSASAVAAAALPSQSFAQEAGVLRVASPWEWTSNEPTDTGYIMARMQIAETLVMVEPDGKLVGGIAESWTVSDDRLTWRFKVRAGVVFHDGTPVTAEAAAASLRRSLAGESMQQIPVDSLSTEGDTLILKTKTPFSHLPAVLADFASVILAPTSCGADGKVSRVIATGPFRITAIDGKTVLELERFDRYWGEKPKVARARYTAIANGDTRTNVAIAGDQDIIFTTVPTATARIDAAGQMKVESLTIPRVRLMMFNAGLPQFSDPNVRRAINMAIDRKGIAAAVLRHPGSAATQLLPATVPAWHDPALPSYPFDVAGANALLDQAGWVRGADGVRSKGGTRLSAKMFTVANRPELAVIGTAMQAQLKAIGMELEVEPVPFANIVAAIRDGAMQISLIARSYVNVPEVIAAIQTDFTRERSTQGTVNWAGRDRAKLLADEYVQSFDEARKAALRKDMLKLIQEEVPVAAVSWFEHTVAVNKRVNGLMIDPFEMRYMLHKVSLN
ncbi:MAG: ABC transporter substrate-binding protein [Microcystis sp. LE19-4.1E]|jgi:peptide/nickel transport system substrate-binding protein|nr:ABC transporter substrate-binding protein [Microcystis sp. LE19-4.1E]